MIDLETLSTRKNAVILVLCAVKFDPHNFKGVDNLEKFYYRVNIESCKKIGMSWDQNTMRWWEQQQPEVREEAFGEPRYGIHQVLREFTAWVKGCERVWSHGASFDVPILEEAYSLCNLPVPWKYYHVRDTRTLYDLAQITLPTTSGSSGGGFGKHNALYDCYQQIEGVVQALNRLQLKN